MSASTGSLSSNILFIRLELEQVQPGNRVIRTVYRSVQNIDHHLAGGADHCPVQMSAEHLALVVPGAHMQVGVKFTVHGVDGAGQRNDLKAKNARPERVFITHSGCKQETVEKVRAYLEELDVFDEILETRAGGVISSHCGPGTLGVLYIAK